MRLTEALKTIDCETLLVHFQGGGFYDADCLLETSDQDEREYEVDAVGIWLLDGCGYRERLVWQISEMPKLEDAINDSIQQDTRPTVQIETMDISEVAAAIDADDYVQENDGTWDVWGVDGSGNQWRINVEIK